MARYKIIWIGLSLIIVLCSLLACVPSEDLPSSDQPMVYEGRVIAILWHLHGGSMDTTRIYFEDGQIIKLNRNLILKVGSQYRIELEQNGNTFPSLLSIELLEDE